MSQEKSIRLQKNGVEEDDSGISYSIVMALLDGPRTMEEIREYYIACARRLGFFRVVMPRHSPKSRRSRKKIPFNDRHGSKIDRLAEMGWIERMADGRYTLTELGREKAEIPIREIQSGRKKFGLTLQRLLNLLTPETVSKITLAVHLVLAAIKLPAGIVSGSVGLINDGADTLLDGLASLLVYFGLRMDKERLVNIALVFLMLVTGSLTFLNAIRRFFLPFEPQVDWYTFAAAIFSAVVCALLWLYQRYVGAEKCSVALITQSIDSRNHVIVAISVTAGLVAALLNFGLLDALVGLAVAILILKSAVELAIELYKSLNGEEVDFTHYKLGVVKQYENFRQNQFCQWMLYVVDESGNMSHAELVARAQQALDFSDNTILSTVGLNQDMSEQGLVERSLQQLFERGWMTGQEIISVTPAGKQQLRQRMRL